MTAPGCPYGWLSPFSPKTESPTAPQIISLSGARPPSRADSRVVLLIYTHICFLSKAAFRRPDCVFVKFTAIIHLKFFLDVVHPTRFLANHCVHLYLVFTVNWARVQQQTVQACHFYCGSAGGSRGAADVLMGWINNCTAILILTVIGNINMWLSYLQTRLKD